MTPLLVHNNIHLNKLEQSDADMVSLVAAIEDKFLDLCHAYHRVKGVHLQIPKEMNADFALWRTTFQRYRMGDFRHTLSEEIAIKNVAQWTIDVNCKLRNQPTVQLVWKD